MPYYPCALLSEQLALRQTPAAPLRGPAPHDLMSTFVLSWHLITGRWRSGTQTRRHDEIELTQVLVLFSWSLFFGVLIWKSSFERSDLPRQHRKAAQMPPVELRHRGEVFGVLVVFGGLVPGERRPGPRWQPIDEPPHLAHGERNAREASRDNQTSQVPLVFQRRRDGEGTSIAGPHEVNLSESQGLADAFHFFHIVSDRVECGAART